MITNHDGDQKNPILKRGMIVGLVGTRSYTCNFFGSKMAFFPNLPILGKCFFLAFFWQNFMKYIENEAQSSKTITTLSKMG